MTVALDKMEFEERRQRLHKFEDRFAFSDDDMEGGFVLRADRCNDERNRGSRGETRDERRDGRGDNGDTGGWMPQREYERMLNSCKVRRIV